MLRCNHWSSLVEYTREMEKKQVSNCSLHFRLGFFVQLICLIDPIKMVILLCADVDKKGQQKTCIFKRLYVSNIEIKFACWNHVFVSFFLFVADSLFIKISWRGKCAKHLICFENENRFITHVQPCFTNCCCKFLCKIYSFFTFFSSARPVHTLSDWSFGRWFVCHTFETFFICNVVLICNRTFDFKNLVNICH